MAMISDEEIDDLDPTDRDALILAIEQTLREKDLARVEQVRHMLDDPHRPWFETASFCSYHRQCRALNLAPWEEPPVHLADHLDDPYRGGLRGPLQVSPEGLKLTRRMLAAGISVYHPDPLKALEEAERED